MSYAMRLVTFSGVDGSGKSTQIGLLADRLRVTGEQPVVLWYRPGYSDRLDRARAVVRGVAPTVLPAPGASAERDRAFRRGTVRRTWLYAALLDAIVQYAWTVRRHLAAGRFVLADRWIWDTRIDLQIRFPELDHGRIESAFERIAPAPSHRFLLLASPEVAAQRLERKAEPFPDDSATAAARRVCYEHLRRRSGMVTLDADGDRETVHRAIVDRVLGS